MVIDFQRKKKKKKKLYRPQLKPTTKHKTRKEKSLSQTGY